MRGARPDDQEIADIILYLLATDQEYHIDSDTLRRSRHCARRQKKRNVQSITKAEEKRLRKQMKRVPT